MAFVCMIVLEDDRPIYRAYARLSDAMALFDAAKTAYFGDHTARGADGKPSFVSNYALFHAEPADARLAVEAVKTGGAQLIYDRVSDEEKSNQRWAEILAEVAERQSSN